MIPKLSDPFQARLDRGLRARKQVARSAHAHFAVAACNQDPLDLLHASERSRIPSLLKIKHERMLNSPFGFFRGAVPIMAADLACHPATGILTQLCGDAHVLNLGAFAAPDGNLSFDINDFDESVPGPFEFDLKRLATSIILAGREAGIKRSVRREAVHRFALRYRESMHLFSTMPVLDLARYQIHRLAHIDPMPDILAQAERSTPLKSLKSLTEPIESGHKAEPLADAHNAKESAILQQRAKDEKSKDHPDNNAERYARRFRSKPPLLTRLSPKDAALVLNSLVAYTQTLQPERRHFLAQYTPLDVAFKVVGTGSIGLRDYLIYFEALSREQGTDPLFLQIKEEPLSAYDAYLPNPNKSSKLPIHQGQRVVDAQRAMQLNSDPFLGYTTIRHEDGNSRDYLVRQLNDHKASLDIDSLTPASLLGYADLCGELFARGHARSGDPVQISAYLGKGNRFDRALHTFADAYADKTENDYNLFKKSLKQSTSKPTKPSAEKSKKKAANKAADKATKKVANKSTKPRKKSNAK